MQIEQDLGTKLFQPGESGYELTSAGAEILDQANHIEAEFSDIDRKIFGQDTKLSGTLRVTCTEVMANVYLAKHFAKFIDLNPDIDFSVSCTNQHINLNRRDADIAIRVTYEPQETLAGKRICDVAVGVYAFRGLAKQFEKENNTESWKWIGWQDESYNRMLIQNKFPDAHISHKVDDMLTMRGMAAEGLGVIALPCYVAEDEPRLQRMIKQPIYQSHFGLWLVYHPDVRQVARVRAFVDFITEIIETDRQIFEGRAL